MIPLVYNPNAGNGKGIKKATNAAAMLLAKGIAVQLIPTTHAGHAQTLCRQLANEEHSTIMICGGDGTLSEAANALANTPVALGFLPGGSGNDFLLHFGIRNLRDAVEALAAGKVRTIDTGRVITMDGNSRLFINIVTLGFSSDVVRTARRKYYRLGTRSYSMAVLHEIINHNHLQATIQTETNCYDEPLTLLSVCNTGSTGGGMWMAPMADASDGKLDFVAARKLTGFELLRLFFDIFRGKHIHHPKVYYERTDKVEIKTTADWFVLDGELLQGVISHIEVVPASLHVIL